MKKVLLVAPVFFNYYKEIIKELQRQGYVVDYIKDIPKSSNWYKALTRINRGFR